MSSPHTPEDLCRQLFQVLHCFTQQASAELDQGTLAAVRGRLGTWVAQLDTTNICGDCGITLCHWLCMATTDI
jgi:hypothetical protein